MTRPTPGPKGSGTDPGTAVARRQDAGSAVEASERGVTTLAEKVVEKIAARASVDVAHALGLSRSLAGRAIGSPTVRANARVDGRVASLGLELAVEYPASARETTREVRAHVTERVSTLCDLDVDHVDITIAVLRRPDADRRRVR